jgi:hypothetical protein
MIFLTTIRTTNRRPALAAKFALKPAAKHALNIVITLKNAIVLPLARVRPTGRQKKRRKITQTCQITPKLL